MLKTYLITDENNSLVSNSTIIKPIIGNQLSAKEYFSHALPWYNQTGKLCTPSEVGCALTHMEIYKEIIASNYDAIIFESDIKPSDEDIRQISKIAIETKVDFLHLGWHPLIEYNVFFKGKYNKSLKLYEINPNINFHGTYSYFITVETAKKLLKFQMKALKPADSWAIFFNQFAITPYFYPFFTHPFERGSIHEQRMRVNTKVFSMTIKNMAFFLNKIYLRSLSRFKNYKNITPDSHENYR